MKEVRKSGERMYYLSKLLDPIAAQIPLWNWGDPNLPTDLPQLIGAIEDETFERLNEIGGRDLEYPYIEGQFNHLHENAINAIERIRLSIRN